ncbi:hypothetical protein PINS_up004430 [Pythium insidiosum]|nr:hypothetical protein PINS_up004430 [Pythium insidiosum]
MWNMTTVIKFYREVLTPIAPTTCVHLPSGVSDCNFGSASLSLAYKDPTTPAPTPASTTAKSSALSFAAAGAWTLAAVTLSTAAQFLL